LTRKTNSRIAGIAFLYYIAAGILGMVVSRRASGGTGIAARLASISEHVTGMRIAYLLAFSTAFAALALGVTLYELVSGAVPFDADGMLKLFALVTEGEPRPLAEIAPGVPEAFHGLGIRIEDDAVVTPEGCELLTRGVPVAADDIEAVMREGAVPV